MRYPSYAEPSDFLVSRVAKEMSKRMLTLQPVWKVRTMAHQMAAERKRQKVTGHLGAGEQRAG